MNKKDYLRSATIQGVPFDNAKKYWDLIELECPDEKKAKKKPKEPKEDEYKTKKGIIMSGDMLMWFEQTWHAWGSPGEGKAISADAFIEQNPDLKKARQIWVAAQEYAKNRPNLIAAGKTPKYFQGWCNDQRWDTKTKDNDSLTDKAAPAHDWVGKKQEYQEAVGAVNNMEKNLGTTGAMESTYKQAVNRRDNLKAELDRLAENIAS